ncbi:hypothetical protein M438DRAFT_348763 [Aureobasidium pullulans EXF-150]|uniref:Uncharacterized protein n=1 Tax=Aureobasidium pullulans EXF-150 TaxID=1043002 RepID=A0A074X557_AURPU|nr:uncharacterized protein M438DRAFT_348763 [Aureobasidium pullulans EXF-150]KEQ80528.1 hypothetical protein M438DRAFT_348763 [Aureobasidium pullulans EXF-150]
MDAESQRLRRVLPRIALSRVIAGRFACTVIVVVLKHMKVEVGISASYGRMAKSS